MTWTITKGPARFESPLAMASAEGDFMDGSNSVSGVAFYDDTTEVAPYEGTKSLRAWTTGSSVAGTHYARQVWVFQNGPDWPDGGVALGPNDGDTFWVGFAVRLPIGYKAAVPGNITIARVDNYGTQQHDGSSQDNRHYLNMRIANNRFEVVSQKFNLPGEQPGLACQYAIPENQWVLIEVKFILSSTAGTVELWANGTQVASNTNIRTFYNRFDRMRFGMASLYNQVQAVTHYMDWCYISPVRIGAPVPVTVNEPSAPVTTDFLYSEADLGTGWEDVSYVKFWVDPPDAQINSPNPDFAMTGLNQPPHWPPGAICYYGGDDSTSTNGRFGINRGVVIAPGSHRVVAQAWRDTNVGGVGTVKHLKGQGMRTFTRSSSATVLAWAPPTLTLPETRTISSAGGGLTLDPNKDYIIEAPYVITGPVTIQGGRNIKWIGGEFRFGASTAFRHAVKLYKNAGNGGVIHLEGLLIDGSNGYINDGIIGGQHASMSVPSGTLGTTILQVQNCRVIIRGDWGLGHTDCFQQYGGWAELRVDRFTGQTEGQGFLLVWEDTPVTNQGVLKRFDLRHVNMSDTPGNAPVDQRSLIHFGSKGGAYAAAYVTGSNRQISNFEDVWITNNIRSYDSNTYPHSTKSNASDGTPVKSVLAGDGLSTSWTLNWDSTGSVKFGTPPGGDFVPAADVGLGYVSPGYA